MTELSCHYCENGMHELSYLTEGVQRCACPCHGARNEAIRHVHIYDGSQTRTGEVRDGDKPGPYLDYGWCAWCHGPIIDYADHAQCDIEMNDDQLLDQFVQWQSEENRKEQEYEQL